MHTDYHRELGNIIYDSLFQIIVGSSKTKSLYPQYSKKQLGNAKKNISCKQMISSMHARNYPKGQLPAYYTFIR